MHSTNHIQYQDGRGNVFVSDDDGKRQWRGAIGKFPGGTVCDFFPLPRVCDGCATSPAEHVDTLARAPTHVHEAANGYKFLVHTPGTKPDESGAITILPPSGAAADLGVAAKCDHGRFGFPKTFVVPGSSPHSPPRRLQYGWVQGAGLQGQEDATWMGLSLKNNHQSLLREVTYDPRLQMLNFQPTPEMRQLRRQVLSSIATATPVPPHGVIELPTPPLLANQSEVRVTFAMPTTRVNFGVRVMTDCVPGGGGGGPACPPLGSVGMEYALSFAPPEQHLSGEVFNATVGKGANGVPAGFGVSPLPLLTSETTLELVVFVDHSVIEVFWQRGRIVMTDHVDSKLFAAPPSLNPVQGVQIWASGPGVTVLNATVWRLADTWSNVTTHGRPWYKPTPHLSTPEPSAQITPASTPEMRMNHSDTSPTTSELDGDPDPIVATFDASGKSPQCSQGRKSYMTDCCFGSDFYFYIVADKPTVGADGVNCTQLGWKESEHIFHGSPDPIFHGMNAYWRGGDPAFDAYDRALHAGHDPLGDIGMFLAAARDHNPACTPTNTTTVITSDITKLVQTAPSHPHPQGEDVAVFFDATASLGQCLEAPYLYLRDCVVPSDFFSFILASKPTILFNTTCSALGYDQVGPGPVFATRVYWRGGNASHSEYMRRYRDGHPDIDRLLTHSRDGNKACSSV